MDTNYEPTGKGIVTGKGVGDFDFLAGEWKIRHKRLNKGTKDEWQRFDSGATVHRVLNGMGSIEELRKADGGDMGMPLAPIGIERRRQKLGMELVDGMDPTWVALHHSIFRNDRSDGWNGDPSRLAGQQQRV